jgi:purine-binding chemotaxis protein CheW
MASAHDVTLDVLERRYMVFRVAAQEFAIDVTAVREARPASPMARIPRAPVYVAGVLNLRGAILPVVDMRVRLDLAGTGDCDPSINIILELEDRRMIGLLVDEVCDIVTVPRDAIQPVPPVEGEAIRDLVKSIATLGERVFGIVSADQIIARNSQGS